MPCCNNVTSLSCEEVDLTQWSKSAKSAAHTLLTGSLHVPGTVHYVHADAAAAYAEQLTLMDRAFMQETSQAYLQLGHLQLRVEAQQGSWLQCQGQEVRERVPVPVLTKDGQSHHRGTSEVATRTAQANCHIATTCKTQMSSILSETRQ